MGASLIIRHHPDCDKPTLQAWIADAVAEDRHNYGSSYSGYWNMKSSGIQYSSRVFGSIEAAETFISDNNEKHEPLIACQTMAQPDIQSSDYTADMRALLAHINERGWRVSKTAERLALEEAATLKSEFKSCAHCGSKIHLKTLLEKVRRTHCPVCSGNLLIKPAHEKAQQREEAELVKLRAKLKAEEDKLRKKLKKDKPVKIWVVGGWCAS